MSWLLLAWLAPALAIECKAPVPHEELVAALDAAEAAYLDLDNEGFRDKVNEISGLLLPCAEDAVTPALAARYHRNLALQLSVVGDEAGALESLQAAKNADPDFAWSDEVLPPDHPLRVAYEGMELTAAGRKVPEPRTGSLAFDGVNGRLRPDTPAVFQVFDATGRPTETRYLGAGEPLPTYRAVPRQRNLLIGCSGGALAASAGTWVGGLSARGALYRNASDPSYPADKLDGHRGTANALSIASTVLFGVAAGCGTGAVLIGER